MFLFEFTEVNVTLIGILVMIFPFIICGYHFKKYGFLQGIFSLLTIPMIFLGIRDLLMVIPQTNIAFNEFFYGLESIYFLYELLFSYTGWTWLYDTGWIYMPFAVLFILSYGYSITFYKKRKHKKVLDKS